MKHATNQAMKTYRSRTQTYISRTHSAGRAREVDVKMGQEDWYFGGASARGAEEEENFGRVSGKETGVFSESKMCAWHTLSLTHTHAHMYIRAQRHIQTYGLLLVCYTYREV